MLDTQLYEREQQTRARLEEVLGAGEQLLWSGSPAPGAKFKGSAALRVFGIFWLAFSLFWEAGALTAVGAAGAAGLFFPLFGLPFVGIGVYMVLVAPQSRNRRLRKSIYGVTDRRVLIMLCTGSGAVRSVDLDAVLSMEVETRADGLGNLYFDTPSDHAYYRRQRVGAQSFYAEPLAFYAVDANAAQQAMLLAKHNQNRE